MRVHHIDGEQTQQHPTNLVALTPRMHGRVESVPTAFQRGRTSHWVKDCVAATDYKGTTDEVVGDSASVNTTWDAGNQVLLVPAKVIFSRSLLGLLRRAARSQTLRRPVRCRRLAAIEHRRTKERC